jgi:hypothetical protein
MAHKARCFIINCRALPVATSNYRGLLMEQTTERAYVHSVKKAYLLFKELGSQEIQHASLTGGESAVERPETLNPH